MKVTRVDAKRAAAEIARLNDELKNFDEKTPWHLQDAIAENKAQREQHAVTIETYYADAEPQWQPVKEQLDGFDEFLTERDDWAEMFDPMATEAERRLDSLREVLDPDWFERAAVAFAEKLEQAQGCCYMWLSYPTRTWLREVLAGPDKSCEEEEEEWGNLVDNLDHAQEKGGKKSKKKDSGSKPRNAGRGVAARKGKGSKQHHRVEDDGW
jgi:CHAD domain-containing protein